MKTKPVQVDFLIVSNLFRLVTIATIDISSIENDKQHHCVITDKNKAKYTYPFPVNYVIKLLPHIKFSKLHKSKAANRAYISTDITATISSELVQMENGEELAVSTRIARRAKAFFKSNKKATWHDFLLSDILKIKKKK